MDSLLAPAPHAGLGADGFSSKMERERERERRQCECEAAAEEEEAACVLCCRDETRRLRQRLSLSAWTLDLDATRAKKKIAKPWVLFPSKCVLADFGKKSGRAVWK